MSKVLNSCFCALLDLTSYSQKVPGEFLLVLWIVPKASKHNMCSATESHLYPKISYDYLAKEAKSKSWSTDKAILNR